ncbi:hypothetical protein BJ508DRAFT_380081 [Ascobolus immersus RN42]|uniref:Uncharacterized protein n=1 Tax=Ascobolus immersus RN42 TaxID=1160509 RepID=A0A3N4HUB3_ASCIM|nr:hypothetical protein BJ508DRAFT_380081 [Ascobolus immersus RN42]
MRVTSVTESERDFVSELSTYLQSAEGSWIIKTYYNEALHFAQVSYSDQDKPVLRDHMRIATVIPELTQVTAEYLLCNFQEIMPYLLQPSTPEVVTGIREDIPRGAYSIVNVPRTIGKLLAQRYRAGLLRQGQVQLLEATYRSYIAEARNLIRNQAGGEEIVEADWQARGLLMFFVHRDFRSERLECLIAKHLRDDGPVDMTLVGMVRAKTLRIQWYRAHLSKSTSSPKALARDRHIWRYDTQLLGALLGLSSVQERKQFINGVAGEDCFVSHYEFFRG